MPKKQATKKSNTEHRQYQRLDWVLGVEFTLVHLNENVIGIGWEKGKTRNVSKEGLCLETSALSESTIKYLTQRNASLELKIALPDKNSLVKAIGDVAWFEKKGGAQSKEYVIGVKFRTLPHSELKRIVKNAR